MPLSALEHLDEARQPEPPLSSSSSAPSSNSKQQQRHPSQQAEPITTTPNEAATALETDGAHVGEGDGGRGPASADRGETGSVTDRAQKRAQQQEEPQRGKRRQHTSLKEVCEALADKVQRFLSSKPESELLQEVQQQTRIAMDVIAEALQKYSLEELSLSYNGGKDCLVLLILYLASLATLPSSTSTTVTSTSASTPTSTSPSQHLPAALQSVYIISPHPFAALTAFVADSATTYHLSLAHYSLPMKEGFARYLDDKKTHEGREIKAILVGTRRTDPHGAQLTFFDPTDGGWPRFVRIHPVIDWHYAEIWAFIRYLEIPYCSLYDMGYTSLGGTTDTNPNPALEDEREGEARGKKVFRPAYELVEDDAERLGRDWR